MNFEWDDAKNAKNIAKHKISFEIAAHVFDDPDHVIIYDVKHSIDEDRFIAFGRVGKVLVVVYTERKDAIRIISARLATNAERSMYYDQDINY